MSAVEEYRRFRSEPVDENGCLANPHTGLSLADAAIAELELVVERLNNVIGVSDQELAGAEAKLERVQHMYDDSLIDMRHLEWKRRAEKAEDEVERLREERDDWQWFARAVCTTNQWERRQDIIARRRDAEVRT